ncbi:MAG: C-type lectin domain-containing protein [Sandaracinaceae bacterium]|nr:C-type lectin domain-containing protein [Sandaracinaceae bacterium]
MDNDCNPLTLDGAAEALGGPCDGPDADMCAEGTVTGCAGGVLECSDATGDSVEVCNGRDDDCDGTIDEGVACTGCMRVGRGARSYLFCAASVPWTTARDACRAFGDYELVSIGDSAEQTFVANTAAAITTPWWWIGLNDRASGGDYVWVADGSALGSYAGWGTGSRTTPGSSAHRTAWPSTRASRPAAVSPAAGTTSAATAP